MTPLPYAGSTNLLPLSIWSLLGSYILVILTAYLLQRIVDRNNLLQNRSILPFLLFILFSSDQFDYFEVTTGKITMLLFTLATSEILSTFHQNEPIKKIYNASFLLSVCILLNLNFLFLIPFLLIAIYLVNKITFRTLHAIVLGLLTPFALLLGYLYISGHLEIINNVVEFKNKLLKNITIDEQLFQLIFLFIIGLIFSRGMIHNQYQNNLQQRKANYVIIWAFSLLSITSLAGLKEGNETMASFSGITSLTAALYFAKTNSLRTHIFLLSLMILLLVFNILISYGTFN
ncbi:MAG: hypothetical protein ACP5F6_06690 [Microbacter sp.]